LSALLTVVVFAPALWSEMQNPDRHFNDYPGYVDFSKHMAEVGSVTRSNFLYPLLVLIGEKVVGNWDVSMLVVALAAMVLTSWALIGMVRAKFPEWKLGSVLMVVIAIQLVGPIALPIAAFNHHWYYGFLVPNLYHNASFLLVKPIALLHFVLLGVALQREENKFSTWFGLIGLLVLSAISKPNYLLCVVPASVLWYAYLRSRGSANMRVLLFGVLLPGAVILLAQYLFTYYYGSVDTEHASIVIAPFAALATHSTFLFWKFLLSIAFPLALLVLCWKRAMGDTLLVGAWLVFIVACCFAYFFAEDGLRLSHMNFVWGAHIAVFLLFTYSTMFYLGIRKSLKGYAIQRYVLPAVLGLHVLCGVIWFGLETIVPARYW
jgi:hypothetical protein